MECAKGVPRTMDETYTKYRPVRREDQAVQKGLATDETRQQTSYRVPGMIRFAINSAILYRNTNQNKPHSPQWTAHWFPSPPSKRAA